MLFAPLLVGAVSVCNAYAGDGATRHEAALRDAGALVHDAGRHLRAMALL